MRELFFKCIGAILVLYTGAAMGWRKGNAAMRRGDLTGAERYLAKTGDSPEAVYARGALAIRQKDYDGARRYLNEAKSLGLEQAAITLEQLGKNDINEYKYH